MERTKISKEQLQKIIASHGKWLRSKEGGVRANLSGVNLCHANLSRADLSGADLREANLRRAYLGYVNLARVDLREADLRETDMYGAIFGKRYYEVACIGSRKGATTYCVDDNNVLCGCWNSHKGGTLAEFKQRVESVYGENGNTPNARYYRQYMAAIDFFEKMKKLQEEWENEN